MLPATQELQSCPGPAPSLILHWRWMTQVSCHCGGAIYIVLISRACQLHCHLQERGSLQIPAALLCSNQQPRKAPCRHQQHFASPREEWCSIRGAQQCCPCPAV